MQFTHEVALTVDTSWREIWAEWNTVSRLPRLLSHLCAAEPTDSEDLARFVIRLEGREVEFIAERTMCADRTLCWQSVGTFFLYVLSLRLEKPRQGSGVVLTLTVAYDPPGFLPDIAESMGLSRHFQQTLEADFRRYARTLQLNSLADLVSAEPMPTD